MERQIWIFANRRTSDGTTIATAGRGSSSSTVRNRNLFCSEQLRDAELNAENGREDGGPAFHSKQSHNGGQAEVASIKAVKQHWEKRQTVHKFEAQGDTGASPCARTHQAADDESCRRLDFLWQRAPPHGTHSFIFLFILSIDGIEPLAKRFDPGPQPRRLVDEFSQTTLLSSLLTPDFF